LVNSIKEDSTYSNGTTQNVGLYIVLVEKTDNEVDGRIGPALKNFGRL